MNRYLVLDRTGGLGPTSEAVILRDGFGWRRLLFPWAWLMVRGLWLTGALVLAVQIALLSLGTPFNIAALLIGFLVALEGPMLVALLKSRRGFQEVAVHYGERRSDVERVYFAAPTASQAVKAVAKPMPTFPVLAGWRSGRSLLATGDSR